MSYDTTKIISYHISGPDIVTHFEYTDMYLVMFAPTLYKENGSVSVNLDFQIWAWVLD